MAGGNGALHEGGNVGCVFSGEVDSAFDSRCCRVPGVELARMWFGVSSEGELIELPRVPGALAEIRKNGYDLLLGHKRRQLLFRNLCLPRPQPPVYD